MHLHGTAFLFRDTFIIIYYIEKVQYWNSMDKQLENLIDILYYNAAYALYSLKILSSTTVCSL